MNKVYELIREMPILWILIGISTPLIGLIFFLIYISEQPPISYQNIPFPVMNDPVPRGDEAILQVNRCNYTDTPLAYSVSRLLIPVDRDTHRTLVLPSVNALVPPGCDTVLSLINTIPASTPPGRYIIDATTSVRGRWRIFVIPWRTVEFTVE